MRLVSYFGAVKFRGPNPRNFPLSKKFTKQQMMSVSGHKTPEMFNRYVKLSLDEVADNVASAACDGLF